MFAFRTGGGPAGSSPYHAEIASFPKVWTAPGIGPVKTEQLLKAGGKTQVTTTTPLLSFTKQAAGS